tara:strand:+ start:774 stop:1169 length:396 start_codon:yes stop_codon:yes gene_type:complete
MSRRVFKNEEERKEANRQKQKSWRLRNPDKVKAKYLREKKSMMSKQKEVRNSIFYVYLQYNSNGDTYIGSGNKSRPTHKHRNQLWLNAFKNDCTIKILGEFTNRQDAYKEEGRVIKQIGLHNLINIKHVNK